MKAPGEVFPAYTSFSEGLENNYNYFVTGSFPGPLIASEVIRDPFRVDANDSSGTFWQFQHSSNSGTLYHTTTHDYTVLIVKIQLQQHSHSSTTTLSVTSYFVCRILYLYPYYTICCSRILYGLQPPVLLRLDCGQNLIDIILKKR